MWFKIINEILVVGKKRSALQPFIWTHSRRPESASTKTSISTLLKGGTTKKPSQTSTNSVVGLLVCVAVSHKKEGRLSPPISCPGTRSRSLSVPFWGLQCLRQVPLVSELGPSPSLMCQRESSLYPSALWCTRFAASRRGFLLSSSIGYLFGWSS